MLVGTSTHDDAGVYKISDELALIQTVDFFTPIVDDPYYYGMIAAANALSDIYAMGGKPLTALNICGFPTDKMSADDIGLILKGGAEKVLEAGAVIIGGHSIENKEPIYGLSVTGIINPAKIFTNSTAKVGDKLILTKPLGIGLVTTGIKAGKLDRNAEEKVITLMCALNRCASEAMVEVDASGCTDITGFGLIGHLREMTVGSGTGAVLYSKDIPYLKEAYDMAKAGITTRLDNFNLSKKYTIYDNSVNKEMRLILCDPQTSGGLLISLPTASVESFKNKTSGKCETYIIGEIIDDRNGAIFVS